MPMIRNQWPNWRVISDHWHHLNLFYILNPKTEDIMRWILLLICSLSYLSAEPLSLVIMGYGGRAQWLFMRCLEEHPDLKILAICDDQAEECLDFSRRECAFHLRERYEKAIQGVKLYPDSLEGIEAMFLEHLDPNLIWITSRNDRHFTHLTQTLKYSQCPKIFMEKPLFRTLQEWKDFDSTLALGKEIIIGLNLRYATMTSIIEEQLKLYKESLGPLYHIKAWEHLGFSHALHSFVLGTRRYRNLWGGLLLEKSIHDIDLALFFVSATGFWPLKMEISTKAEHQFFTQENLTTILSYCDNLELKKRIETLLIQEYPFSTQKASFHLIPDYHLLSATLIGEEGRKVGFEIETDMSAYRSVMQRGLCLSFEKGKVLIDIMKSSMTITLQDQTTLTFDLHTLQSDHADGDQYVVHAILHEEMPKNHHKVTFFDPVVQLANEIALISEEQIHTNDQK